MNPGHRLSASVLTARRHHQGTASIQSTAHYRIFAFRENIQPEMSSLTLESHRHTLPD